MFTTPEEVKNLLHNVNYWGMANDGINYSVLIDFMLYEVQASAVKAVHSDLPRAIDGLITAAREQGYAMPKVKAALVLHSYYMLSGPTYQFIDVHDDTCMITTVRNLLWDQDYDRVEIESDIVTVVTKEDPLGSYRYVSHVSSGTVIVYNDMLERQYPGWSSRWYVAESLDLSDPAFMAHVFTHEPKLGTTPGELPALTFD